jgi:hypothetical protein
MLPQQLFLFKPLPILAPLTDLDQTINKMPLYNMVMIEWGKNDLQWQLFCLLQHKPNVGKKCVAISHPMTCDPAKKGPQNPHNGHKARIKIKNVTKRVLPILGMTLGQ